MQKYPELVTLIRFEDLLENMGTVVRSVCAHIGIAFDPGMLNYYQQQKGRVQDKIRKYQYQAQAR